MTLSTLCMNSCFPPKGGISVTLMLNKLPFVTLLPNTLLETLHISTKPALDTGWTKGYDWWLFGQVTPFRAGIKSAMVWLPALHYHLTWQVANLGFFLTAVADAACLFFASFSFLAQKRRLIITELSASLLASYFATTPQSKQSVILMSFWHSRMTCLPTTARLRLSAWLIWKHDQW